IQPLPWIRAQDGRVGFYDTTLAALAPGITGRAVNAGHWGETPDFPRAMGAWRSFQLPRTSDSERRGLLERSRVRYILFSQKHELDLKTVFDGQLPQYLKRVEQ